MASCERCKQRKAKCDRRLPACQRCEKAKVECEYGGRRKPGFPAGHRQMLEEKIEKLESELRAIRSTPRTSTSTDQAPPQDTIEVETKSPNDQAIRSMPVGEASPTFERTRRVTERRPPTDLVVSLASLYFRHIHPWFPFLDVQRVCVDMGSMDEPALLYYALFGVTLPYSFDSRLDQASSDSFWKYSKRSIFVDVLEEPSYSSLEVLTVLVLDLSGMTHGPQVWGPLAVATKLAVQLKNTDGLVFRTSTEADSSESLSKSDGIFRQRLFWAIYALDCTICITTNHHSTLGDDHVHHFLPARQQVWRENLSEVDDVSLTPASVFSYQLELFDLSRRIHRVGMEYGMLYNNQELESTWLSQFHNIAAELTSWMETLPSRLFWHNHNIVEDRVPGAIRPATFMLYGYYYALDIYLNGFLAIPCHFNFQSDSHLDIRRQCLERCLNSVQALAQIITKVADQTVDKLGWPFAWSVWVAARFLTAQRYFTGETDTETIAKVSLFTTFLSTMGRFWQISASYARMLRRATSDLDAGTEPGQGTILQLMADLRVPTSHIEDQFRPDSMLHGVISPGQSVSMYDNPTYMDVEKLDTLLPVFADDACFDMSQDQDNWFRMPLFASSAYQQFNAPEQE
ncbi:positive regulator of purine utilization [Fusarium sp. NRRL 25303]|nr:positive regulator of purine utilization [Fusarium sp. NRRL 25303]